MPGNLVSRFMPIGPGDDYFELAKRLASHTSKNAQLYWQPTARLAVFSIVHWYIFIRLVWFGDHLIYNIFLLFLLEISPFGNASQGLAQVIHPGSIRPVDVELKTGRNQVLKQCPSHLPAATARANRQSDIRPHTTLDNIISAKSFWVFVRQLFHHNT